VEEVFVLVGRGSSNSSKIELFTYRYLRPILGFRYLAPFTIGGGSMSINLGLNRRIMGRLKS
jgi:hypothetical protein